MAKFIDTFLRKLEQRDAISAEEREALSLAAEAPANYPAGGDLVREGDRVERSMLMVSGMSARYRVLEGGQRQITAFHIAGDFVDLHSLLLKEMDHSVGAISDCQVLLFPHENLKRVTEQFPHLTRLLWLMTLVDSAIQREWLVAMGRRSAGQQLAHLICELYVRLGVAGLIQDDSFIFPVTQTTLADALGVSPVHVNRLLQDLRGENFFTWIGQTIHVTDWAGLQRYAEFHPLYLHLNREPR